MAGWCLWVLLLEVSLSRSFGGTSLVCGVDGIPKATALVLDCRGEATSFDPEATALVELFALSGGRVFPMTFADAFLKVASSIGGTLTCSCCCLSWKSC